MKIIAVIPARYSSTRFPGKLMKKLGEKTVIRTTYENVVETQLFDEVFVVTDSKLIYDEISMHGGKVMMSIKEHETGSDRIAEAIENIDADVVLNVQGDEPFINRKALADLLMTFRGEEAEDVSLSTLKIEIKKEEEIHNPNVVKVVTDAQNYALYFSRSPIPFSRDTTFHPTYYRHVGVYAFRREALLKFAKLAPLQNELAEKLEQLRYMEYGMRIKVVETDFVGIGIDTKEDLEQARKLL
ncbi:MULTISPECIES: 3-deoxy-manno-octulosonate cytidylyltransferase [Weeksella]|uniref:3-deoxy-manno-octulosonate cytidylyltransferase n=1 Tax=Weeksella virosa (strain ATCC 43766 / DSM 16922 / JCM 21250 / CCUG 30538 / CDC 9751 / IAM 14551 / NBRC 16016 / NCTC 11634 / CL345/78) TaxID=865938 RepID=F0P0S4_WEEVC|nr:MULTISPECIES: 3-deoxy-manno-octulosonate cytidylyltransferase [Weeksella]ADX67488.1 3-deoxy-manno-octulosonate cytidylyltransferase [Weeksella virosa DSM 16922]MDK7374286.1 3-deoxy-manno-octulosonate cytidylyltransferase [Weeksella virosa]MDK7675769.1 3-deoxy-manno-octulosonate cytidylyltransferase [Weeksella virosa]OFM82161.1 3-deoxy-manno-octulosonate cytidylyltransferase [Weeksella sp. HMSC059D05]SUP53782.1 3-deoxy-manno-octulosonate cytidylyltransferase [Weeksella virosa]